MQVQPILQQDWIAKWALYSPNKVAVREAETGRVLTYGQLDRLSDALCAYLQEQYGIKMGDHIALLAENNLEYIALFAAMQRMGFVLVPLNYRLAAAEIDYLLQDAAPKLIICEAKFEPQLKAGHELAKVAHYMPWSTLSDFCEQAKDEVHPAFLLQPVGADHPAFILYTSGTTGFPKGAIYSHKMLFWNSINTAMSLIVNTESRTVNVMPPFHTGGWNVLTTPFLHHGGYTVLMRKFDPERVLQLLQEERATLFMGVPTILKMMAEAPGFEAAKFSDLYYLIVGGEPMPIPLIEKWDKKGVPVRQGYGMTEVGPNLFSLHQDDAIRKKGSIGRPNYYVQTRIVDAQGRDTAQGEAGELWLKGPMVTPGYWQNEAATQKSMTDGWFHTGDMVRADEGHYFFVVDRIKNMYISGGENVYPAEVERVLQAHPDVAEAAVIGVPDEKWGESGRAFVVLKAGAAAVEVEALRTYCKAHLAKFKVPREVVFLPELPKNDTGKINRTALKG
ncbi:MAG: long-chain fatty acid--CoA ligase [Phaeodactylibacter sp.]|uniref:class I adenylate-forming enzyme family protein n=1 Tax=Phaeodactylibacter sp. TaxID=1940289 RepID=UPI0032EFDE00